MSATSYGTDVLIVGAGPVGLFTVFEAAMAAHAVYPLALPDEAVDVEYSTTKGVPDRS